VGRYVGIPTSPVSVFKLGRVVTGKVNKLVQLDNVNHFSSESCQG